MVIGSIGLPPCVSNVTVKVIFSSSFGSCEPLNISQPASIATHMMTIIAIRISKCFFIFSSNIEIL